MTEKAKEKSVGELISLSETPKLPKESYDLRVLQSLRRIIRAVEIHSRKLIQSHQVTGPQLTCLMALAETPLTLTALAQAVYLSASTVVGIVDRLEEKGLLQRNRSHQDRRQVLISLTADGSRLISDAPSPLQDRLAEALQNLPELEQVSITLALEKIVDLMEVRNIDAAPLLETGTITAGLRQKSPAAE